MRSAPNVTAVKAANNITATSAVQHVAASGLRLQARVYCLRGPIVKAAGQTNLRKMLSGKWLHSRLQLQVSARPAVQLLSLVEWQAGRRTDARRAFWQGTKQFPGYSSLWSALDKVEVSSATIGKQPGA